MPNNELRKRAEQALASIDPQYYLGMAFNFCTPEDAKIGFSRIEASDVYDAYVIVYDVTFQPIDKVNGAVLISKVVTKKRIKYDFLEIDLYGYHIGMVFYLNNPPIKASWIKDPESSAFDKLEFCFYVK